MTQQKVYQIVAELSGCALWCINAKDVVSGQWSDVSLVLQSLAGISNLRVIQTEIKHFTDEMLALELNKFNSFTQRSNRHCLLLMGAYLDDHITPAALGALAYGFDVYLIVDVMTGRNDEFRATHFERLYQAGAVPSTLSQFLRMWIGTSSDDAKILIENVLSMHCSGFPP